MVLEPISKYGLEITGKYISNEKEGMIAGELYQWHRQGIEYGKTET